MQLPLEMARVPLGTPAGEFDVRAFQCSSGFVYLALVKGELGDGRSVLTRLHSECLTGDALGSQRCDCGNQLRLALRAIAAEGRGVLVYATGHEGRGIGLVNKLRSYVLQDNGADTVEANLHLGFTADERDYADAGRCLALLGVRSVRLLTNNPDKVAGLRDAGIEVDELVALTAAPHARNLEYLRTKQRRLGHVAPTGAQLATGVGDAIDIGRLLGNAVPPDSRPYVVVKYAQSVDGRIATGSGDAKWVSGEAERRVSHALRAACDAVLVGVGTVVADDPLLTVRLVPGTSPVRVVLDSSIRLPFSSQVLNEEASTLLVTTARSANTRRAALRARGVSVEVVASALDGVDLPAALRVLRGLGVRSLLVEGRARVITSFLSQGLLDRLVVGIAPKIIGAGTEAVGDLGVSRVADALSLADLSFFRAGDDLLIAADVGGRRLQAVSEGAEPPPATPLRRRSR